MFPPKKDGPPGKPKSSAPGQSAPQGQPGPGDQGPASLGAALMPHQGPPPGMPLPGRGMDPMAAMMGGLSSMLPPSPPQPQGPPMGQDGMPFGASMPGCADGSCGDMGGSDLLQALHASMGGDPYGQPPGGPDHAFDGTGAGDPTMGLHAMLQMLALAQGGVGGGGAGMPAGGSGVPVPPSSLGAALGLG